jgi:hypothetical protein
MLKTLISIGLSILVFTRGLHVELHNHNHPDGYSICEIGCDDEHHHYSFHQCEKCLNNTNRLIAQEFIELSFNEYQTALYSSNENFEDKIIPFNLYSRPPPSLI